MKPLNTNRKMTEQDLQKLKNAGREDLVEIYWINKLGVAGILSNGNIVDRRKHPEAIAVPENELMGIPTPSILHKCLECENIEREEDLEWDSHIHMSHCPKCKSEKLEQL